MNHLWRLKVIYLFNNFYEGKSELYQLRAREVITESDRKRIKELLKDNTKLRDNYIKLYKTIKEKINES